MITNSTGRTNSIIDPNDAISSDSLIKFGLNATPDYSDMIIFAELTAIRRGSSILTTNGVGKKADLSEANPEVKINLMGFDKETGLYTTRWTNNIGEGRVPYEGFGITQIKMKTNSSYVPQIEIEFVDIRGLSLVSLGSRSPYSVLYSFPPPIFTLTIKGYYGKALSYNIHLMKSSTKFDATSGNYFITATFIAQRFAPLTDVLFKYVDVFPLIVSNFNLEGKEENNNVTPSLDSPPKNTRDLIVKTKKLYDDIDRFKTSSSEASELNKLKDEFTRGQILLNSITNFKSIISSDLQENFGLFIMNQDANFDFEFSTNLSSNDNNQLIKVRFLKEYDEIIKKTTPNEQNSNNVKQRLRILYEYDETINDNQDNILDSKILNLINENLINLTKNLLEKGKNFYKNLGDDTIVYLTTNPIVINRKKYIGIDITKFYIDIYQKIVELDILYKRNLTIFKEKINDISNKNLGFKPTIRNIFSIILNDIEIFFRILRETCRQAEIEHKKNFNRIVQNNSVNNKPNNRFENKTISAFPLIIKKTSIADPNNLDNILVRNERAYPGDPQVGFSDVYFPEVNLVEDFIDAFINIIKEERILNLKESIDADGNNKWIPVNPLDSVVNGRLKADSPYKGVTKIIGTNNEKSVLSELINRFYVISQYSYGFTFYDDDNAFVKDLGNFFGIVIENTNDKLITFLAKAEATNLVNSIFDVTLLESLKTQVDNWIKTDPNNVENSGVNQFYKTLESSSTLYSDLSEQYIILNDEKIVKLRSSSEYRGFELLFNPPVLRNKSSNGSNEESFNKINFVERFVDEVGNQPFYRDIFFKNIGFDDFTKQNIVYIKDKASSNIFDSDFIENTANIDSLIKFFADSLSRNDLIIKKLLIDDEITDNVKMYYITTIMCRALSYYSSKRDINKKFAFPAVIEVPVFAHLNMGALMYFFKSSENQQSNQSELTLFLEKYSEELKISKKPTTDTQYVNNIADNDANLLIQYFLKYVQETIGSSNFLNLKNRIITIINEVNSLGFRTTSKKYDEYFKRLNGDVDIKTERNYSDILKQLNKKLYLLNYTQITFNPTEQANNDSPISINQFIPLKNLVTKNMNGFTTRTKQINDNYFTLFFSEVSKLCEEKKNELYNFERGFKQGIEDNDIKNQTYYSLKSIADKWIAGFNDKFAFGMQNPLIKEFSFVDRFFNDVGDKVVIDIRPIIELSQDYDVSVYSVLTKILALNGFEFFPLQNFIDFEQEEWSNSFKTYGSSRTLIKSQTPSFICMYIGGSSSFLNDFQSDFEDDGVANLRELESLPDYKTGNVKGFKVNFAKQNQSMFMNIQLDTNEHKETNESLAVLSEIAQDQSAGSPVPKGQNLFETYEQRSYTCTIESFGNAMIQPTQYFILENVPMFNGAYLIIEVEHSISPNNMKTVFKGLRIRTNPNPLVTDFSTATGVKAGDNDTITNGIVNEAGNYIDDGTNRNNPNSTNNAGFVTSDVFPVTPTITRDMTGRLISP